MSLLLDALKRAEEAKRAKGQDAQLDGASANATVTVKDSIKPAPDIPELSLEEYRAPLPEMVAPPLLSTSARPVLDFTRDSPVDQGSNTAANSTASTRARAADAQSALPTAAPPTARPTGPAAPRLVRQDFSLKSDAGAVQDESVQREAAKNIFSAKQTADSSDWSARGKWLLPLIAFLVVGIGAAGWYGWKEVTRITRGASLPFIARPAGAPAPGALPSPQLTTGQVGTKTPDAAAAAIVLALPPLLPPPAIETALPRPAPGRSNGAPGQVTSERERLAQSLKDASLRTRREAPVSLRLSQNINPPRVNSEVLAAYAALSAGDYAQAQQRYEKVVQTEPFNLDAHLGLAAAAARSGDNSLAAQHYRRALEIDPRNGAALSGMLAVSSGVNPQALEIELKTLIAKDPGSAALQFSLGNLYAGDRRWSEAQQAYFEAYRLESENADYRYNLAVALDQMKQSKLALDYYQKALAQAGKSGGQFDRAAVQRRIGELKIP